MIKHWDNAENLSSRVVLALLEAFDEFPRVGWVRGNTAASSELLAEINELRKKKQNSNRKWSNSV
jgi:hypothetical protein